jgi:hypothetical protein
MEIMERATAVVGPSAGSRRCCDCSIGSLIRTMACASSGRDLRDRDVLELRRHGRSSSRS